MQVLHDNPISVKEEFNLITHDVHTSLPFNLTFIPELLCYLFRHPKIAILHKKGVNGQIKMGWTFTAAGFDAVDLHMSDLLSGAVSLKDFCGFAAFGGFSYGDVLRSRKGWANSALLNDIACCEFSEFFARKDTFGV